MKKNKSFLQKEELQVDKQPVAGITQKLWNNKMVCSFFYQEILIISKWPKRFWKSPTIAANWQRYL